MKCVSCWRDAPNGGYCDTCRKGESLGAPSKLTPWNGSHPPPEPPRKNAMTEHKTPTNSDHCNHGKGWTVDCEECGRRAGGEVLSRHAVRVRLEMLEHAVFGLTNSAPRKAPRTDGIPLSPESNRIIDDLMSASEKPVGSSEASADYMGIIRAAEGVALEPGEYEVVEIAEWDDSPGHRIGERFTVHGKHTVGFNERGRFWVAGSELRRLTERTLVTAVRRVEPEQGERPIVVELSCDRHTVCHHEIRCPFPRRRCSNADCQDNECRTGRERDPAPKAEPSANSEDMALAKSWRKAELELRSIHGEHDARSITERLDSASKLTVIQKLIDVVRQRDAALSRIGELEARHRVASPSVVEVIRTELRKLTGGGR